MSDYPDAERDALQKAAKYIRAYLERSTPGHHGSDWKISRTAKGFSVRNRTWPVVMTDSGKRHPLFGDRSRWYGENERNPGRTGWAERAILDAADEAEEQFGNEYLERIAIDSPYFNRA